MLASLSCLVLACAPAGDASGTWTMRDEGTGYTWILSLSQVGQFASAAMYRGAEFQTVVGEVRSNEVMLPFDGGSYRVRLVDGRLSGIGRGRNVQGWKVVPVPRRVRAEIDEDEDVMAQRDSERERWAQVSGEPLPPRAVRPDIVDPEIRALLGLAQIRLPPTPAEAPK